MSFKKDPAPVTSEPQINPASHDTQSPPALLELMKRDWKAPPARKVAKVKGHAAFARRRRALSRRFPGEVLVIPTGHEKTRANDTTYRFRPGSDFYYLTGCLEPDCVLVLEPTATGHREVLYVEPNPGRQDSTFFTDRVKGELWVGPRLGVNGSEIRFGVEKARGLPELDGYLRSLGARVRKKYRVLRELSAEVDALLPGRPERDKELGSFLSEQRLIKDALELRELQTAVDATHLGFEDVIRQLRHGGTERHVEGIFNLRARVEGNDVGYGTIAAAGANACVLHWTRNDGPLRKGELLLLDAGVESNSLYTADVTRTLPLSGRFTLPQREVYDLVFQAQEAGLAAVQPGNDFLEPNRQAMVVLAHGLERMGILRSAEEALRPENLFHKRYTLHNVSHMLGLDVHDCARARQQTYKYGKLEPGMVLTVEPGLYFQKDDLTVPARYRGIGVRIEDDVVVTPGGMHNLSQDIPAEAEDIEAWMAALWE